MLLHRFASSLAELNIGAVEVAPRFHGSRVAWPVACYKGPPPSNTDAALASAQGRRLSLRLRGLQLEVRLRLPMEHEARLAGLRGPVADRCRVLR